MKVTLKSQYKTHYAHGEYDGKGIMVLKGSVINTIDTYPKMPTAIKSWRHNSELVSESGEVQRDIYFSTPSAAAVFVTGRSSNGYIAWRVEDRVSLKEYIKNQKQASREQ